MAELIGTKTQSFRVKHKDAVDNVKRKMLQYVRELQDEAEESAEEEDNTVDMDAQLKLTPTGFPVLPNPKNWQTSLKKTLEVLIRTYLSHNYG
jgi:hypothetical protein